MLQAMIMRNDLEVVWELSSANTVLEEWRSGQFKIDPKAEEGDFQVRIFSFSHQMKHVKKI
jgi:hypothetical protein